MQVCYHCGDTITEGHEIIFDEKKFCCNGCQTVYEILSENELTQYYDFEITPGLTPTETQQKFAYLDQDEIVETLLDFRDDTISVIHLQVPQIHCSSCIWILEHLFKLNTHIIYSQVDFSKKQVVLHYQHEHTSLRAIVELLAKLGYEPYLSLENTEQKPRWVDRSLVYKIGVAFFCFGNIMLLSFPEYFGVKDIWIDEYRNFFRYLNLLLALPVFFYSASPYFSAAYLSLKHKKLSIDVPMALGILVMFVRSLVDIFILDGAGFLDSMAGLVLFMLSGKLIQQTSYKYLSFERDYKSYFPIAVTKIEQGNEVPIQVYDVQASDKLLIRNGELIPVDAYLLSDEAYIDYSFVTGEANPVKKKAGDKIYAGGKQIGAAIEISAISAVSQSYLTELWSNDIFQKEKHATFENITNRASKIFTPVLLILAVSGLLFWLIFGTTVDAFNVFTAVLIVACPCAIALTAPYTWGNVIRYFGRKKFYLKNTTVIEQLARIDTIVFDKTGTLTSNVQNQLAYFGTELTSKDRSAIKNMVRNSNHPLSRRLYDYLNKEPYLSIQQYEELAGKGIQATVEGQRYRIGSQSWITGEVFDNTSSSVYIEKQGVLLGYFLFENTYRSGLDTLLDALKQEQIQLYLLSGDHDGEYPMLSEKYPQFTSYVFNQKPIDKLEYIQSLQAKGHKVLMVGDGLNDAGALAQSDVGISIAENVNVFTPASDAILDATSFRWLAAFIRYAKNSMKTIRYSYLLAIAYNVVGLSFALSNQLSPLVAAIIMPISTLTIISFVSLMTYHYYRKIR